MLNCELIAKTTTPSVQETEPTPGNHPYTPWLRMLNDKRFAKGFLIEHP